ncbi:GntR family transcriptional regulator [Actinopolyspora mortivallis]|uniref:GntR family transcriptional regulator n=1 Tax=Actinopolyspora mortivallis TaxID=33906 RepID=UPI000479AB56|nr:GntR family transcriptional regulator [Actinopolyspora mortivallis]
MSLDPDDPRPPYIQVASALRAAILTRTYQPGDRLPSGAELGRQYGVARMTAQQALRVLREEGLVTSRQGSGVFVRERTERPIGLRPHIERAFEAEHIAIDFAGFSGETLHGVIQEPLDKIRVGRLTPQSLKIRMLLPDTQNPMPLPCKVDGLEDSPAFRARADGIMRRHTQAIMDSVQELGSFGLVPETSAEVRVHPTAPLFKLYVLNNSEIFFGFYPVREHVVPLNGEDTPIYDLMGKDATLFQHAADEDEESTGSQYVKQSQIWFESMWTTVSREFKP